MCRYPDYTTKPADEVASEVHPHPDLHLARGGDSEALQIQVARALARRSIGVVEIERPEASQEVAVECCRGVIEQVDEIHERADPQALVETRQLDGTVQAQVG